MRVSAAGAFLRRCDRFPPPTVASVGAAGIRLVAIPAAGKFRPQAFPLAAMPRKRTADHERIPPLCHNTIRHRPCHPAAGDRKASLVLGVAASLRPTSSDDVTMEIAVYIEIARMAGRSFTIS